MFHVPIYRVKTNERSPPLMDTLLYYLTVLLPVTVLLVVQSERHTTTIPFPIPDIHITRD